LITKSCQLSQKKCNYISFWELSFEKINQSHLPYQFNKKNYELLKAFQREKTINDHVHTTYVNAKGDASYTP
jgi:hypothetical protein